MLGWEFAILLKIAHIIDSLDKVPIFRMFLTVFHCFFPLFYAQERIAPVALFFFALDKRAIVSESLPSLFRTKDHSLFFTRKSLFCSFAHKKRAICSKNLWANSQPWFAVCSNEHAHLHIIPYKKWMEGKRWNSLCTTRHNIKLMY